MVVARENALQLGVEAVEDRTLLTASLNVSVSGGVLLIQGDSHNDNLVLEETASGQLEVMAGLGTIATAGAGTTQSGHNVIVSGTLTGIDIELGNGNNRIETLGVSLPGTFTINEGTGLNTILLLQTSAASTAVNITSTGRTLLQTSKSAFGATNINLGSATATRAEHALILSTTFNGNVNITTGGGADIVTLGAYNFDGQTLPDVFNGNTSVSLGGGTDHVSVSVSTYNGNLTLDGGTGTANTAAGYPTVTGTVTVTNFQPNEITRVKV